MSVHTDVSKIESDLHEARVQGRTIAFCDGSFEVVHKGHIQLFEKARAVADVVVIAVASDEYIATTKGHIPKYSIEQRVARVMETGLADFVFAKPLLTQDEYIQLCKRIQPNYFVTGEDETLEDRKKEAEIVGCEVVTIKNIDSSQNYL